MASLDSALQAVGSALESALASANLQQRGIVLVGNAVVTEWEEIAGQDSGGAIVTVLPIGTGNYDNPNPENVQNIITASPGTTLTLTSLTGAAVGGVPKAGDTVHLFFAGSQGHAGYLVTGSDNADTIAAALASAITAAGIPGVAGAASGVDVSISGSTFSKANVGGSGSFSVEVGRDFRMIQITVWASSGNDVAAALNDRGAIGEAIILSFGQLDSNRILDANNDEVYVTLTGDFWDDQASDSYTTFKWIITAEMVYSIMRTYTTSQLEAILNVSTTNVPATTWVG